ncbi:MAG: glycoside hydrolase family 2 protein [Bacteroides nordii]|nr:glycoside hydrolase family 2 protein [Bacteroides nordii]
MKKSLFTAMLALFFLTHGQMIWAVDKTASVHTRYTFERGWKFIRSDDANFSLFDYDDSSWQQVTVPHDWAIYGPFSIQNDRQKVAIAQDGQKEAMEHAGRTGGLPFVGVGWYRLDFEAPAFAKGKKATLVFDGAMSHARVYVNGKEAGYWPYGYNTFYLDVTPYLNAEGKNTLAVRLENEVESSRWYPGAGLYRNVHLIVNEEAHIPMWGTQLTTPVVEDNFARVHLNTSWVMPEGKSPSSYRIVTEIKDADGKVVSKESKQLTDFDNQIFSQEFVVEKPMLWTPDTPYLYIAESKVYEGNTLKDESVTPFGIRSIEVIPDKGFFLNGKKTVFKGVCNHHDLGPLGAAVNDAAIRRQIRILKDMGCNAIRTSHNMPAPELVKACDEMGMMLMVETFDEWKTAKCENGYHKEFDQWVEKDLVNVLRHYRNNPSVVMWCVGNEVPDQWNGDRGPKLSRYLQDICHREDPTRPVTQGMDAPDAVINNNMAAVMDVAGFNYRPHKYQEAYKKLPQQIILGSETASTVSSRGIYKFPVTRTWMKKYDDHQSSSYDVEHCGWSNLPEDDFIQHEDLPYCIGEFVWTGFDYLGEPTPYYTDWPSHSSLFGIIDLAGLPKDRYYLYRSHWNKEKETLHILPHWNWKGREGEVTPVFVYTNYPSAELFINGKSQGKRTKDLSVTVYNSADSVSMMSLKRQQRYRLMWMDTKYEPGTVKVVAYDENGKAVAEKEIHTAGKPHHIELVPDRRMLQADGKDLCFVTVKVVDKDGNLCPEATDEIRFKVKGSGVYCAGANGNPASLESFQIPRMKVFSGMMTAVIQTTDKAGAIVLEATGSGLKKATLTVESK